MGERARGAVRFAGVLLLVVGLPVLGLGFILRETGLFGMLFLAGGGYLVTEGGLILLEAWLRGRRNSS
ncbi:MAG: hypothetical protein ABR499_08145 [Gemmatimonadaceae bacterium]